MKRRKTLSLSSQAIERGEQVAAQSGKSLSAVIEERLLSIPTGMDEVEEFWPGAPLKPLNRHGDARFEFLKRKHT